MTSTNPSNSQEPTFGEMSFEDQIELGKNLQIAGGIWFEVLSKMQAKAEPIAISDPLKAIEKASEYWQGFWSNPDEVFAQQIGFMNNMQALWLRHFSTEDDETPSYTPKSKHRLYQDEAWQRDAISRYLQSVYDYLHNWVGDIAFGVEAEDGHKKNATVLGARNTVEGLSPANYPWSNPKVIEATLREKGENLVRGMTMMREDVERGRGELLIRQTDLDAFEVGRNIATTEGAVIFENEHFQIIQYSPKTETVRATPIMIVPPWINKYYILDLNSEKSYAKWIVEQGYTVFMISWFNADESARDLNWDDRVEAINGAIDVVLAETQAPKAHLISFCIGGTLVGTLLAKLSKLGDERVASTTFLTAQFDFENSGELQAFVTEETIDALAKHDERGFIPATAMSNTFNLLRSSDLIWNYIVNNYFLGKTPPAFDLLYWNSDSMNMPTQIQKFYLREFYLNNAFMKNALPLDGDVVGAQDISHPTYHLAAIDDHIAPANSVYVAAQAMKNADVRFVMSGSGHIAGVVNPPAKEKYQYWRNDDLSQTFEEWHANAQSTKGSWWLDWIEWLGAFDTDMVEARAVGAHHNVIELAPGRYVKRRFEEVV